MEIKPLTDKNKRTNSPKGRNPLQNLAKTNTKKIPSKETLNHTSKQCTNNIEDLIFKKLSGEQIPDRQKLESELSKMGETFPKVLQRQSPQ